MARISDVFQSRFLKPIDLQDEATGEYRNVRVSISEVNLEELPSRNGKSQIQPVLSFAGKKKVLPLNKTNATTVQEQLGDETDNWIGQTIGLYVTTTPFEGTQKTVIRVTPRGRVAAPPPRPAAAAAPDEWAEAAPQPVAARPAPRPAAPPAPATKPFDPDEIPF